MMFETSSIELWAGSPFTRLNWMKPKTIPSAHTAKPA
jgi:hypothetical protein